MITGDSMYTAASTGAKLNFGSSNHLFLVPDTSSPGTFKWINIDDEDFQPLEISSLETLRQKYCLCVEGKSIKAMEEQQDKTLFETVVRNSVIFARVSPEQKEKIITIFKEGGKGVLMCGDGTNDVAALKKSDVGIALVGIKDEKSKAVKKAEKEKKQKLYKEAVKNRRMDLLKDIYVEEDTEFKGGDACIAAPFTNKHSNSIKCGKCHPPFYLFMHLLSTYSSSGHHHEIGLLHFDHLDPNLQDSHTSVLDSGLLHE